MVFDHYQKDFQLYSFQALLTGWWRKCPRLIWLWAMSAQQWPSGGSEKKVRNSWFPSITLLHPSIHGWMEGLPYQEQFLKKNFPNVCHSYPLIWHSWLMFTNQPCSLNANLGALCSMGYLPETHLKLKSCLLIIHFAVSPNHFEICTEYGSDTAVHSARFWNDWATEARVGNFFQSPGKIRKFPWKNVLAEIDFFSPYWKKLKIGGICLV